MGEQLIERAYHLCSLTGDAENHRTALRASEACLSGLLGVLFSYSHDLSYSADFKSVWFYGSSCSWPSLRLPIPHRR